MVRPRSEHLEQAMFVRHVRVTRPDVIIHSIPNGGARRPSEALRLKLEGALPGTPDLFIAEPSGEWHGFYVEMKRSAGGSVSKEQRELIRRLVMKGYRAEVCKGLDKAVYAWE
ncbi:MAG: VRR-NUC domain-containing protein, partial [Deltaproteobacteria bacterium]|nr:VRR-NUC domain-containing protein [Deltaproteobacteria bacterium]